MAEFHHSSNNVTRNFSGGQILVEYVLMLVLVVGIAVLLAKALIKSDPSAPGNSGIIVKVWSNMTQAIGQDHADDVQ